MRHLAPLLCAALLLTHSAALLADELIGPGEIPKRYFALWAAQGKCEGQNAPFYPDAMLIGRKAIGLEKLACPVSEVLADNGKDRFKATFNCISIGENRMHTQPIELRLEDDQLYFSLDGGAEQGPYIDCRIPTIESRH